MAHEALIQHWARLQGWLAQDQALRLFQHRLLPFVRQWEASGRDADELLRGALLAEAEEFAHSEGVGLSDREHLFVDASITVRNQRQSELEARRQAELDQAQALARSEHQQAEAANRARQRLRWMAAGLAAVLALALLATWIAVGQGRAANRNATTAITAQARAEGNASLAASAQATAEAESARAEVEAARAETNAQIALSRQLAAQAISLADEELDTALLLSLESLPALIFRRRAHRVAFRPVSAALSDHYSPRACGGDLRFGRRSRRRHPAF